MISKGINKTQERIKKNFEDKDFLELFNKVTIAMPEIIPIEYKIKLFTISFLP